MSVKGASGMARTSAAMVLTIQGKWIFIFRREGIHLPDVSRFRNEKCKPIFLFAKTNSAEQGFPSNLLYKTPQNLNVSRLVLQLSLPNPLKLGVELRMKM